MTLSVVQKSLWMGMVFQGWTRMPKKYQKKLLARICQQNIIYFYQALIPTVDGWNPANQLRLVAYPIIYKVHTSQVVQDFFHQQY